MPAFLIPALGFLRANWKFVGLGLLCLALAIQTLRLGAANNRADRIQIHLNEARAELKRISTAKNEQKAETVKRVEQAEKGDAEGKRTADKIRNAPIVPGKCETPGLDILRNEI
jgi:hypothetical protein